MALLSKEAILGAPDLRHAEVEVPEWGGTVRLRVMTGRERMALQKAMERDRDGIIEQLIVLTAVDAEGRSLFDAGDVKALAAKSAPALERCFAVAAELNGLTKGSIDTLAGE